VSPFESIYTQHFDFVWASARRLGVGEEAVDDVVQEVFIVIHKRLHTLEQPEALRSWIYGIVRRTVSSHHRARRHRTGSGVTSTDDIELPSLRPLASDLAEQSDQVKLLYGLLDELPPTKREVFTLVEIDELTVPEVAGLLEIPLNTAYSRLRSARLDFDAALSRRSALPVATRGRR
jgi:RNA polymerase sigma-70 factor (ECF subfamily)